MINKKQLNEANKNWRNFNDRKYNSPMDFLHDIINEISKNKDQYEAIFEAIEEYGSEQRRIGYDSCKTLTNKGDVNL